MLLASVGVILLIYAGLIGLAFFFQRSMIYYPSKWTESACAKEAAAYGLQPWRTSNGQLIGWKTPPQPGAGGGAEASLIVLHGNANHAQHCGYYAQGFQSNFQLRRWDVYLLEYPGYACRPGKPSQGTLVAAALEGLEELKTAAPGKPVFLLGESIGSSVAAQVAARKPELVAGMLFIAPATSLIEAGAHHAPFLPVKLLLLDTYKSDQALKNYHGPIAFLLAGQDEVIPPAISQKLYEGYSGPKKVWLQPYATHNTFNFEPTEPFWKEVAEFLMKEARAGREAPAR